MSHSHAIALLEEVFQGKRDAMSCLFTLARVEPEAFVRGLTGESVPDAPDWTVDVIRRIKSMNLVSAIKLIREARGIGLKEAKDLADEARQFDSDAQMVRVLTKDIPLTPHSANIYR